jgi:predicted amidohydrolase
MRANLVAVQLRASLEDYASGEAFRRRMTGLMEQAERTVDFSLPTIVCFPETVGLWLSFVPEVYDQIRDCTTIQGALVRGIPRNLRRFLGACWRYRTIGVPTIFLETALEAEEIYRETFSGLARRYGCYLQAGTLYVPPIEDEPVKGRHMLGRKVYNTAYLFGPNGLCLQRVPKRNLAPPLEHRFGFTAGAKTDLHPIDTPLGRLGILICYDGFHESLVEYYDNLGVQIVLTPSHSDRNWEQPTGFNNAITVGEAWARHGIAPMIQGRLNIRYALVAMMAGRVLDLEGQGCSHIAYNTGEVDAPPQRFLLAQATSHTGEEIVAATVDLPEQPGSIHAPQASGEPCDGQRGTG